MGGYVQKCGFDKRPDGDLVGGSQSEGLKQQIIAKTQSGWGTLRGKLEMTQEWGNLGHEVQERRKDNIDG